MTRRRWLWAPAAGEPPLPNQTGAHLPGPLPHRLLTEAGPRCLEPGYHPPCPPTLRAISGGRRGTAEEAVGAGERPLRTGRAERLPAGTQARYLHSIQQN